VAAMPEITAIKEQKAVLDSDGQKYSLSESTFIIYFNDGEGSAPIHSIAKSLTNISHPFLRYIFAPSYKWDILWPVRGHFVEINSPSLRGMRLKYSLPQCC
jgi:hypothetical protein